MINRIEQPSFLEVLDRILDKGIVVDAWVKYSLVGLDLLTLEARMVVDSLETYLGYTGPRRTFQLQSAPPEQEKVVAINQRWR